MQNKGSLKSDQVCLYVSVGDMNQQFDKVIQTQNSIINLNMIKAIVSTFALAWVQGMNNNAIRKIAAMDH